MILSRIHESCDISTMLIFHLRKHFVIATTSSEGKLTIKSTAYLGKLHAKSGIKRLPRSDRYTFPSAVVSHKQASTKKCLSADICAETYH